MEGVEAVENLVNIPGRISYGGSATDVVIFAASPEYLKMASVKTDYGKEYSSGNENTIVNTSVLNLMGIKEVNYDSALNEEAKITLLIPAELLGQEQGSEVKEVEKILKIVGVISDTETPYLFIPLQVAKEEGVINYSQAKVKVTDSTKLEDVRQKFESLGFSTTSAADTVQQIDQIFSIFRVILASFGSIALVVSALGMFNTLTVSLLERTREVGLMKALGAKRSAVFALFLSESLLISIIGGVIGILLGWGAGELTNFLLNRLAAVTGNEAVDIFQTPLLFIGGILIFSFMVGFLTGLYPSKRASSLNPLDALRYE